MTHLPTSVSAAVRTFSYFLASGSHYMLKGVEYLSLYGEEPSAIEQTYAIFMNILEIDDEGNVTNQRYAEKRATDYLKQYCGGSAVDPPYAQWEVALY